MEVLAGQRSWRPDLELVAERGGIGLDHVQRPDIRRAGRGCVVVGNQDLPASGILEIDRQAAVPAVRGREHGGRRDTGEQ